VKKTPVKTAFSLASVVYATRRRRRRRRTRLCRLWRLRRGLRADLIQRSRAA
jgi:hypothetical protein